MDADLEDVKQLANRAKLHYLILMTPDGKVTSAALANPDNFTDEIAGIYFRELLAAHRR